MFMNRFLTGAVIGGTLGALGVAYALSNSMQKKQLLNRGKQLIDVTNHKIHEMM